MLAVALGQDISDVYAEAMRDIIAKYEFEVSLKS
jgi:hypothetical protein